MAVALMNIDTFAAIEAEFLERVHRVVWCNMATLDRQGRPRSRILHPFWENGIGWIATGRHTLKAKHLGQHPYVSLAYIADIVKPVYVDAIAEWEDDPAAKRHVWEFFAAAPPPLGYDPAPIFQSVDHPDFGALKLTPWRIELADFPTGRRVWHASAS